MSGRSILVVEENAHLAAGHLATLFADVASNFAAVGCEVTVLTKRGWLHDSGDRVLPFRLVQPGRVAAVFNAFAALLSRMPPPAIGRRLGTHLAAVVFALTTRRLAKRLEADVVDVSLRLQSYLLLTLARRGRWLVYQFVAPRPVSLVRAKPLLGWAIRSASRARAASGGALVIMCNNEENCRKWGSTGFDLPSVYRTFASSRVREPIADARQRLGLGEHWRILLAFGTDHEGKSPEIAFELFDQLERSGELPDWHLVVFGKVANRIESWRPGAFQNSDRVHLFGGYQSEEMCDLAHAAADVELLSFAPGWDLDSGVLTDAIGWGLPVVCSSGNQTAAEVERLRVGRLFDAGNPESLRKALLALPAELNPLVLAEARRERSGEAHARAQLALLDSSVTRRRTLTLVGVQS